MILAIYENGECYIKYSDIDLQLHVPTILDGYTVTAVNYKYVEDSDKLSADVFEVKCSITAADELIAKGWQQILKFSELYREVLKLEKQHTKEIIKNGWYENYTGDTYYVIRDQKPLIKMDIISGQTIEKPSVKEKIRYLPQMNLNKLRGIF